MTKSLEKVMAEAAEQERKHLALMATLEIPSYSDRHLDAQWVQSRRQEGEFFSITGTTGWTAGCSKEVYDLLPEGKAYVLESDNRNRITGWIIDGKWYDRLSDQDLNRLHERWKANWERERRESLEKNRSDWQAREAALPDWVRLRLETFHTRGGVNFELDGWGYELIIAELAVEYAALGEVILDKNLAAVSPFESKAIKTIAHEQGTTGNQHGMALALAKAHLAEPERTLGDTVSALAPLSGKPFYDEN